ncbi:hypothetical protein NQ318_009553 [Aromia moschata]|uniref:Uncharacterized protein n=1 Tax=Aromia moschata TaxID=1265417 RepID=A0AAV8YB03_9CUCU|nr:hypothetical protein NQ318_009553 [Aromia moschata]
MSSTISTTELQTIPPRAIARLKMEEKPRLVRTSSIEKIRRFNNFICSQHYYILPALLSWLKSSQSGLQTSTEKTIFFFRSLIFNTFFYKFYLMVSKFGFSAGRSASKIQEDVRRALLAIISNFYRKFTNCVESTFLLAFAVYSACVLVVIHLAVVVYLMYLAFLPYGFIFMVGCIATINCLCYRTMFFFISNRSRSRK